MKKTILSLAMLAACTLAIANNNSAPKDHHDGHGHHGHHGPKTPDVKTPPTKPDTSGPKAPPSAPPARSTRDEGQHDTGTLCSRWPTLLFCDHP